MLASSSGFAAPKTTEQARRRAEGEGSVGRGKTNLLVCPASADADSSGGSGVVRWLQCLDASIWIDAAVLGVRGRQVRAGARTGCEVRRADGGDSAGTAAALEARQRRAVEGQAEAWSPQRIWLVECGRGVQVEEEEEGELSAVAARNFLVPQSPASSAALFFSTRERAHSANNSYWPSPRDSQTIDLWAELKPPPSPRPMLECKCLPARRGQSPRRSRAKASPRPSAGRLVIAVIAVIAVTLLRQSLGSSGQRAAGHACPARLLFLPAVRLTFLGSAWLGRNHLRSEPPPLQGCRWLDAPRCRCLPVVPPSPTPHLIHDPPG